MDLPHPIYFSLTKTRHLLFFLVACTLFLEMFVYVFYVNRNPPFDATAVPHDKQNYLSYTYTYFSSAYNQCVFLFFVLCLLVVVYDYKSRGCQ